MDERGPSLVWFFLGTCGAPRAISDGRGKIHHSPQRHRETRRVLRSSKFIPVGSLHCAARCFRGSCHCWLFEQLGIDAAKNSPSLVKAYSKFEQILQDFGRKQMLPFGQKAADIFDDLVRQKLGQVGTMDLRIAAIALQPTPLYPLL